MLDLVERGLSAKRESKYIDFKSSLDFNESGSWCEIIKDIIAMANSGGGLILIGLNNNGTPSGFDSTPILNLDTALIADKIHKYTGTHFDDFEISKEDKDGNPIAALLVKPVRIPIVFTSPGTYNVSNKKQKTAFSKGTVYFRHGAKSEPGTTEDIRKAVERQLDSIRKLWVSGVRKVVKTPPDHQIVALAPGNEVVETKLPKAMAIRLTDDPSAPAYRKLNTDDTYPYRQKELICEVNKKLKGKAIINSYDILVIRRIYPVNDKPEFVYQTKFGSIQYSEAFAQWIIDEYEKSSDFFTNTRAEAYKRNY
ncbi:MAG: RNA-binding domain-containing protein [Planctomycetota bacterium]|jgi:hypothetical protein